MVSKLPIITISPGAPSEECLLAAETVLRAGALVVAPTETRYGLLARADRSESVEAVYALKQRPFSSAVAVFVSGLAVAEECAVVTPAARRLAERFLPGPLTLLLEHRKGALDAVARAGKIGVRVSSSPFVARLLERLQFPLTATSANLSGQEEPSSALAIADRFKKKVHLYVDAGPLVSEVSTVVDCTGGQPIVTREGAISVGDIHAVWREE